MFGSDIPAGTTIRWRINPVDEYDNQIKINLNKDFLRQNLFKYSVEFNGQSQTKSDIP